MRRVPRAAYSAAILALAAGCVATQSDVLQLSQQTDNLTVQIQGLKKTLGNLQTNQADLAVKLDQVHSEITSLNENLKDNREGMSKLSGKLDDLSASLSSKVSSLDQSLTQQKKFIEAAEESRRASEEGRRKAAEEQAAAAKAAAAAVFEQPALSPTGVYASARKQLSQKKYDLAIQGFRLYLEKFPKGESVEPATYYLGQAYFAKKEWEPAARQYALVIDRYPKSEFTPGARLRYAACLMDLKTHLDEAKRYLESISEDFPKSPEAGKAAAILKDFDAKFPSAAKKTPASGT